MAVLDRRVAGVVLRLTFQRAEVAVQVAASALVDELVTARPARHDVIASGIVSAVTVGDECLPPHHHSQPQDLRLIRHLSQASAR